MNPTPTHLLYLHGFRSSPWSAKARRLHAWLQQHRPDVQWHCPQIPPSPRLAMQQIEEMLADWPQGRYAVLGSSLGGFYATVVAQAHGCPAVLLNPAIDPARDLLGHVGEQTGFHDPAVHFVFDARYVDELRAMNPGALTCPERYAVVIAKGDDVLDWREMASRYAGCNLRLLEGSDHGLSDFDEHLPFITHFLQLNP